MLEVQDLSVHFSDSTEYLFHDLTFQLQAGDLLWLKGPNGCGKTSLLYAMSNIIPQHIHAMRAGHIAINSKVIDDLPLNLLLPDLALAMQNPEQQILFPTVEEEIIYTLENMGVADPLIEERLNQSMDKFDLAQYRKINPHNLSVGYQKLLMLCIIDAASPEVILLDEPLNGLSDCNIELVLNRLEEFKQKGKTIVIAEHNDQIRDLSTNQLSLVRGGYSYA